MPFNDNIQIYWSFYDSSLFLSMIISLKNHIEEIVQEKDSANIAGKYPKPDQEQDE